MSQQFNILCKESTLFKAWSIVRQKAAAGGIDGMTIECFNEQRTTQIEKIREELLNGIWKPMPYMQVYVPKTKDPAEKRTLAMAAVRDKVVQQALRGIIEPKIERTLFPNSYAYRPHKGALKAIKYAIRQSGNLDNGYALRLDVDDFFDNIDHAILQKRLTAVGVDTELVRLIMLSVKIGRVNKGAGEWKEYSKGIPQGAVLSPLLSNLYMHSFDQFAVSRNVPYARYGDDILFLCEKKELAEEIQVKSQGFLNSRLGLPIHTPELTSVSDGFDFLGINVRGKNISILDRKREEVCGMILALEFGSDGFAPKSKRTWDGTYNYYTHLLPQPELEAFDALLVKRITAVIESTDTFKSKTSVRYSLGFVRFLSKRYESSRKQFVEDMVGIYLNNKAKGKICSDEETNRKIIQERKREFRQMETEASGLLVDKPGTFVGLTSRGITVSQKGKVIACHHKGNLSQIIITGKGVSLSSNIIDFCLSNGIPVDFFDHHGTHRGSVLTAKSIQTSLWRKQSCADEELRKQMSLGIMIGKVKNQFALLKYFHKYHKKHYPNLQEKMDNMVTCVDTFKSWMKGSVCGTEDFMQKLMGHEAQIAIRYWDYIRELLTDDEVGFERREHKGATDLMNSMLNYGYAILYVRVWQALLAARLNPFDSLIHVPQEGKPTLVYDLVEVFRSQVVDRVVITLIQKGHNLEVRNGLLTDHSRQLLVKSIMERLSRYEKYQGEEIKMELIIKRQAKAIAKAFDEGVKYKPYVAKW